MNARAQPCAPDTSRDKQNAHRGDTACVTTCPSAILPRDLVTPFSSALSMTAMSWINVQGSSSVMTTSSASCADSAPKRKCHTERVDEPLVDDNMLLSGFAVNVWTCSGNCLMTRRQLQHHTIEAVLCCVCVSLPLQPICCCHHCTPVRF